MAFTRVPTFRIEKAADDFYRVLFGFDTLTSTYTQLEAEERLANIRDNQALVDHALHLAEIAEIAEYEAWNDPEHLAYLDSLCRHSNA